MKFAKLALVFGLIVSMQSQAGLFNWLSRHDNTVTACIPAAIASWFTSAMVQIVRDKRTFDIFDFSPTKPFDRYSMGAGLLAAATTFALVKWYLGPDKKSEKSA